MKEAELHVLQFPVPLSWVASRSMPGKFLCKK